MTVYKHDRANIAKLLPGARFQLERYEPGGEGSYAWQTTSVTAQGEDGAFVVGESGMIVLNFLSEEQDGGSRYNLLYRIRETAPPAGYLQSDAVYYFVWMEQGASREQTVERMRQSGALGDVSPDAVQFIPFSTAGTLYVPNEPDQLTVTKQWQQHSGMPLQHPPSQSVKVTLYQWRADGSRTVYQTVELHGQNNWSHTWTALPKADADGGAYRYTVEEEHVPGFTPTYSANNDSGVQTGEIVITNTEQDGYVLPETGGVGTPLYTAAGLLLIAAFCAGYMGRRYGRP